MSLEQARNLLWDFTLWMTDEELKIFLNQCKKIASIIVDFAEEEAQK